MVMLVVALLAGAGPFGLVEVAEVPPAVWVAADVAEEGPVTGSSVPVGGRFRGLGEELTWLSAGGAVSTSMHF